METTLKNPGEFGRRARCMGYIAVGIGGLTTNSPYIEL